MTSRKFGDRAGPWGRLGLMLGAALLALAGALSGGAAQALPTLYSFTGGSDGANPYAGSLIFDAAGNLYGTTQQRGGSGGCGGFGCGTVFKLAPDGTLTVLYSFAGGSD